MTAVRLKAVLVTGSRHWSEQHAIQRMLDIAKPSVLIHGNAPGADNIAGIFAATLGIGVIPMPARWDLYGKSAGPKRNELMVHLLDTLKTAGYAVAVYAFPLDGSVGTWGCVRLAKRARLPVYVWRDGLFYLETTNV